VMIVKYVALLQAGLPHDDVKIVILRNLLPREDHAAVAAGVDGQWLILDNRRLALVRDTKMVGSIPKFVLDQDGTQGFVPSNRAGQGASDGRSSPAGFAPACLMLGTNGEEEIDTLPGDGTGIDCTPLIRPRRFSCDGRIV
jgi:hypothetical protein